MSEKSDYVMLPPKGGSATRKPVRRYIIFGFLLVVVAAVSWWVGQSSKTQQSNAEIKQVPTSSESPSDPQLANAPATNPGSAAVAAPEIPGGENGAPAAKPASSLPDSARNAVGGIVISTTPAGAKLAVTHMDDKSLTVSSATPATLTDLPAGYYDMTLEMPGYKTSDATFEIVPGKMREVGPLALVRTVGHLEISATAGTRWELFTKETEGEGAAELVASGQAPGKKLDLPTADYEVSLIRERWPTVKREIKIAENMTTEVSHDFPEGDLELTTLPEGADVWIKGEEDEAAAKAGVTPLSLENLPVGAYEVVLKNREGPNKTLMLKVEPEKITEAHASWLKSDIVLTSDPPGATVYAGGVRLAGEDSSVTPMTAQLPEGDHELRAVKAGLEDVRMAVNIAGDRENSASFPFKYGSLRIETTPGGADVFLGADKLGQTPLTVEQFQPGEYKLRVRKERYATKILDCRVLAGARADVSVELNYEPTPAPGDDFTNGAGQRMKWVAAIDGWVETTETPQMAYARIVHQNPSEFKGDSLPVHNVTWNDAIKFCEQLTVADRGQGLVPEGYRYLLPTDAQWTVIATGTPLTRAVTSKGKGREGPMPAASLEANELGLHDTLGNVWEWCFDWYTQEVFNREQRENASGKSDRIGLRFKILRGGSWSRSLEGNLAVGHRLLADPGSPRNYETGFRVVLVKEESGD